MLLQIFFPDKIFMTEHHAAKLQFLRNDFLLHKTEWMILHFIVKLKVPPHVPLRVMVRSGQVRLNSDSNSNSKVGPELYTSV